MSDDSEYNKKIINEFRKNDGKVGGHFTGRTLLLLHTTGAKSGQERINPTAYIRDNERYAIIASNSGEEKHPSWYHNILANSVVIIEVGNETLQATASLAEEPEYTRLYNKMVDMMPGFAEYRLNPHRIIPVIVLTPIN